MRIFHIGLIEDLADLVADRVVNALNVQLRGERGLHAVDHRQFLRALFRDLEQALGLVEETRVLEATLIALDESVCNRRTSFSL